MAAPTPAQLLAALIAARKAIDAESSLYSSMITDDILTPVLKAAITAALNA